VNSKKENVKIFDFVPVTSKNSASVRGVERHPKPFVLQRLIQHYTSPYDIYHVQYNTSAG
jgi:hypothetical protein